MRRSSHAGEIPGWTRDSRTPNRRVSCGSAADSLLQSPGSSVRAVHGTKIEVGISSSFLLDLPGSCLSLTFEIGGLRLLRKLGVEGINLSEINVGCVPTKRNGGLDVVLCGCAPPLPLLELMQEVLELFGLLAQGDQVVAGSSVVGAVSYEPVADGDAEGDEAGPPVTALKGSIVVVRNSSVRSRSRGLKTEDQVWAEVRPEELSTTARPSNIGGVAQSQSHIRATNKINEKN